MMKIQISALAVFSSQRRGEERRGGEETEEAAVVLMYDNRLVDHFVCRRVIENHTE